ncbi:hypothetical protein LU604_04240 [Erwinia tracheiphila]|uniref:Uncharacterized protein n=1 Tax=Erwinia tracheiphila TaxID=65700 RepID=A0A345CUD1_9GAMM|nr:hypothetical protein [Erwinia tracheiphila]AXF77048.1 hypothetical protein AV903_15110 [Erwinia tracheiphila]UIA84265.1 hypothetical protein LU604_04240 [Erwinia tracheiphila]UIA92846.1 hypothetical protein LU632_04195 [Erwinia tracheiphila]
MFIEIYGFIACIILSILIGINFFELRHNRKKLPIFISQIRTILAACFKFISGENYMNDISSIGNKISKPPIDVGSLSRAGSENNLINNILSVGNANDRDLSFFSSNDASSVLNEDVADKSLVNSFKNKLAGVAKFIRDWGPNHIILQAGPQLYNKSGGFYYKFTPTAVISSDHIELYPLYVEIGHAISELGGGNVKGYALCANQQGLNVDWNKRELGYLRQMLGRVEADFPYGDSGFQGTVGFEIGITDKMTGVRNIIKDACSDFKISAAQGLSLVGVNFAANPDLIKIVTAGLIGTFCLPEVISRLTNQDNSRESVLWMGLSFGYADYNSTYFPDLEILKDSQHQGVNIQANACVRHAEMITYNFKNKVFSIPHALIKALTLAHGGSKPDIIRNILSSQAEINHAVSQSFLPAEAGHTANDCLNEIALLSFRRIEEDENQRHERNNLVTEV